MKPNTSRRRTATATVSMRTSKQFQCSWRTFTAAILLCNNAHAHMRASAFVISPHHHIHTSARTCSTLISQSLVHVDQQFATFGSGMHSHDRRMQQTSTFLQNSATEEDIEVTVDNQRERTSSSSSRRKHNNHARKPMGFANNNDRKKKQGK